MSTAASRTALAAVVGALALGVLAASAPAQVPGPADPRGVDPKSPNPLLGLRLFVDHKNPAWRQYAYYRRNLQSEAAAQMWKVAEEPKFRWFGRWDRPLGRRVRDYIARARRAGAVPLMATLRHQGTGCGGGYDGGGPAEDDRSRAWYRALARAIGSARVVIGFEPDSLGTVKCLRPDRRKARLDLLRYGVDVLSRLPGATIYLEGGASDWEPAAGVAAKLRYIGISKVRGFMVNVTHYDWTGNNVLYGLQVSRLTGGKPFVISTAFNGRGPLHLWRAVSGHRRRVNVWCHPPRRGLGPRPTTDTANPRVDAYLWIGRPGFSAGACNGGPLPVGSWWPERALMYARYATNWVFPGRP
jgi:endoglucanase